MLLDAVARIQAEIPSCSRCIRGRGARLEALGGRLPPCRGLRLIEPLAYLDFVQLMASARCVLTDSGGIQEETTALRVPCLTLRENTERPITVTRGTNRIVGMDPDAIFEAWRDVADRAAGRRASCPSSGTARRPERIVRVLLHGVALRGAPPWRSRAR